jgi:hypothetical protein
LGHLLSASSNIFVTDLIQVSFLVFTLDGLALAMDDCILGNDAILRRVDLHDFEFHLPHATTDCEEVALSDRSVGLAEVWGKENVEQGAGQALDSISDGENGNALGLLAD